MKKDYLQMHIMAINFADFHFDSLEVCNVKLLYKSIAYNFVNKIFTLNFLLDLFSFKFFDKDKPVDSLPQEFHRETNQVF